MTVGVVDFALLLIAEDAVGFRALAELHFGFFFVFRVAVRVPLQRGFAISGLDFLDGRSTRDAEHLVKISLVPSWHAILSVGISSQLLSMRRPGERLRGPWPGAEPAREKCTPVGRLAKSCRPHAGQFPCDP